MRRRAIVVGAGHNGLVTACYLAQAGWDVTVLEALDRPGGGSRTEETIPGHRFDLHSAAHNIINMTAIPEELELRQTGLRYLEMDPFSIAVREDQRHVRFHRSVEDTVASIAEHDPVEAEEYRTFVAVGDHLLDTMLPSIRGELRLTDVPRRVLAGVRLLRASSPMELLNPYSTLLRRRLGSDLTRGPIAAFAAHAGVGPNVPGSAAFALWQAAYHRFGQWHGTGGAQNLTDSLVARLDAWGGELRCATPVARIERRGDEVQAVVLEDGERIDADVVVTAIDPKTALLDLLTPALEGQASQDLAATRRSNVVQAVVHVATDRLPAYAGGRPGDANGLQSYVDRLVTLEQAWILAEAGLVPDEVPWYAFTSSAIDDTLAPAGHHTVYLACPAAPAEVRGGWDAERDRFVDSALEAVEVRAPGFRDSVLAVRPWLPSDMMRAERWPGAHPMIFDIAIDQLGPGRPTPSMADHRTPVGGLYVTGAGTSPTGGIAGTPGRLAANAVLDDHGPPSGGRRASRRRRA
ncbi:MAG: phytoene desaturase family protein [Acidimicrobiales bacterium]